MRFFRQDTTGDRGASMVEYGLIVALIALMALSAVTLLGERTEETFTTVAAELEGQESHQGDNNDSEQESDDSDDDHGGNAGDQSGNQDDQNQDDQNQDDSSDDQNQDESSDDQNGSDDSQDQQGDGNDDDSGNNGDDSNNSGGSDEDEEAGSDPVVSSTNSEFYWWNDTKHGGNGAWTASVSYSNDTNRHQYLDLRITRVDEKGSESVSTYNSFYVPAGGSTTYTHWNNELRDHQGRLTGTVEVKVEVTKVRTSDQNWQAVSYEVDGKPATVVAPPTR